MSSLDSNAKISNEKNWPDTIGFQKMVDITPISTKDVNGAHSDDWVVAIQENLVFEMTGDFFRCDDGTACGCTVINGTWTDCEAFIMKMAEMTIENNIFPRYTYVTILAQIGGLALLGFFVFRMTTGILFYIERRKEVKYTVAETQ